MKNSKKIAIAGSGSFGTALAYLFHFLYKIFLWEYNPERAVQMQNDRKCRHLKNVLLPETVTVSSNIAEVVINASIIILAIPSDTVESTVIKMKPYLKKTQKIVICSKGFALGQKLLSDAIRKILPDNPIFCLSGPALAMEIVKGKLTSMVLAGIGGRSLKKLLQSTVLKIKLSKDIKGVQLGGGLKNPYTIAIGIGEGAEMGSNFSAFLIPECLKEVKRIGQRFGACNKTFNGEAFLGDLSLPSRNRKYGNLRGTKKTHEEALAEIEDFVEGPATLQNAYQFARHHNLHVPIIEMTYQIVFEGKDPHAGMTELWAQLN